MAVSSIFPILIGLVIWFFVRDDPSEKGYQSHIQHELPKDTKPWAHALSGLTDVMRYRNTWLLSIIPGGVVGSILSFAGLWGVPFLTTHYGFSKGDAAAICSAMLISWAIGGPIFGAYSDRIGLRKPLYVIGCSVIAMGWSTIVLVSDMPSVLLISLLLVIGFASGCMIIGFAFAKESVPAHRAGTVSGIVNMGVMMGPMILQPAVGWMLDRGWQGETINGVKVYNESVYQSGFMLMAGWAIVSFILVLFTLETKAQGLAKS